MLTLKVPEELLAGLAEHAERAKESRHRAALLALDAGLRALRDGGRGGDTGGDTPVTPWGDTSALADLVAERVAVRLAGNTGGDTGRRRPANRNGARAELPARVAAAPADPAEAPESQSGRVPGQAPRRSGDYRIGGRRPNDPPEGSVAALLLTWRRSRGLSQGQAAEAFGVQRTTWCRWETGKRFPEADVVDRVKAELAT